MDNEFRKDKLNNGCIVQIRAGEKFIFLKSANNDYRKEDVFININDFTWLALNEYSNNLTHLEDNSYDIVKICDYSYVGTNLAKHLANDEDIKHLRLPYIDWTAVREDIKVVE